MMRIFRPLRGLRLAGAAGPGCLAVLAAVLAGCSDAVLDVGPAKYLYQQTVGETPPAAPPSPVRGLSPQPGAYPNLASVPPRPDDAPTPAQVAAELQGLAQARADNRLAADVLSDRSVGLAPLAVPPPPGLAPAPRPKDVR